MKHLVKPGRVAAMVVLVILILVIYLTFLYRLQIIEGEKYYNQSNEITNTERTVTASSMRLPRSVSVPTACWLTSFSTGCTPNRT